MTGTPVRSRVGYPVEGDFHSPFGTPIVVDRDTGDAYILASNNQIMRINRETIIHTESTDPPDNSMGENGDYALDIHQMIWRKESGSWVAKQQLTGQTGPQGPQGPQGNPGTNGTNGANGTNGTNGPANTLTIGTVTTGSAGASITGTSPNQTLNLVLPTGSRTFTQIPSKTLNSYFQVSTTRDAFVSYSVRVDTNATVLLGELANVNLTIADNNSGLNAAIISGGPCGVGSGLVVSLSNTSVVAGCVPAGKWARINATDIIGAAVFTFSVGQEVLL